MRRRSCGFLLRRPRQSAISSGECASFSGISSGEWPISYMSMYTVGASKGSRRKIHMCRQTPSAHKSAARPE